MKIVFKPLSRLLSVVFCLIHCLAFSEGDSKKKEVAIGGLIFETIQSGIFAMGGLNVKDPNGEGHIIERSQLIIPTNTVQAKLHVSFGIKYLVTKSKDFGPITAVHIISHPPMVNPRTKESSVQTRSVGELHPNHIGLSLWTFEEPFEMVPGSYVFRVFHNGEKVLEQAFLVTPASELEKKAPNP